MEKFLYINKLINNRELLLYYVNRAGYGKVNVDFNIERSNLYPNCVIHYVIKGSGHVIYGGKDYSIKQGNMFILNAFEGHRYFTDKDNLLEISWLEFAGGDSEKLITAILRNCGPIIMAPYSQRINKYLLRIFKIIKNNKQDNEFLISKIIYSILLNLLYMNKNNSSNFPISRLADISKVTYFIDNNLGQNINIQKLASISCYSPTYFAKLFHKVMGNTPMNYVLVKRINESKELLSKTSISSEQIAQILGFCSSSHFIKSFKKVEGLTPAEYRRHSLMFLS